MKPTITRTRTIYEGDKIKKLIAIKVVKKAGNSGHVILPKELIGKEVKIQYDLQ